MRPRFSMCLSLSVVVLGCASGSPRSSGAGVVPEQERDIVRDLSVDGPTETLGIQASKVLGTVSLDAEFDGLEGHMLRAREVTVLAGGQVAVHRHESRPGIAYILEGEMVEHRSGAPEAATKRIGDVALENSGVVHWWKNESAKEARVLVVDIVRLDSP